MFFRSSSALRRDPMQRKWKLLTSKKNWKKQKVRSTSQSRISQMASIFSLPGPYLRPYLLMNFLLSINWNIWKLPQMFSVDGLNFCFSSPFKHVVGFPGMSYIILRSAGIPGASILTHLAGLPSALLTESGFAEVTGRFLNLETKPQFTDLQNGA